MHPTYHGSLVFVWLYAADKEWLAGIECLHQSVKGFLELGSQGWCTLPGVRALVKCNMDM